MIKGIHLKQFQSFAEPVDIPWNNMTIAVGPNSAGKSAVVDAIAYLAEAFKHLLAMDSDVNKLYAECRRRDSINASDRERPGSQKELRQSWLHNYYDSDFEVGIQINDDLPDAASLAPQDAAGRLTREERDWADGLLHSIQGQNLKITLVGLVSGIKFEVNGMPLMEFEDTMSENPLYRLFDGNEDAKEAVSEWASLNYQDELAEIRINLAHPNLSKSLPISIVEILGLSSADKKLIHAYAPIKNNWLTIGGLYAPLSDNSRPDDLFILTGEEASPLDDSLDSLVEWVRTERPEVDLQQFKELNHTSPLEMRRKVQSARLSITKQFNLVLKVVIRRFLEHVGRVGVVSGSRAVLGPNDCFMLENDEASGSPILRNFAIGAFGHSWTPERATQFVNEALQELLSGMRGLQVRIATYKPTQYGKVHLHQGAHRQKAAQIFVEDASGRQLMPWEVGSGFSYVLPILVALQQRGTVLIQQPELHLHPAAQCEVADIVIAAVTRGGQAWVETHSEHYILRLLRRVRETTHGRRINEKLRLRADDVTVLFFQPQDDGTTQIIKLRVDEEGEFMDRWPGGFFPERDRELFSE